MKKLNEDCPTLISEGIAKCVLTEKVYTGKSTWKGETQELDTENRMVRGEARAKATNVDGETILESAPSDELLAPNNAEAALTFDDMLFALAKSKTKINEPTQQRPLEECGFHVEEEDEHGKVIILCVENDDDNGNDAIENEEKESDYTEVLQELEELQIGDDDE